MLGQYCHDPILGIISLCLIAQGEGKRPKCKEHQTNKRANFPIELDEVRVISRNRTQVHKKSRRRTTTSSEVMLCARVRAISNGTDISSTGLLVLCNSETSRPWSSQVSLSQRISGSTEARRHDQQWPRSINRLENLLCEPVSSLPRASIGHLDPIYGVLHIHQ